METVMKLIVCKPFREDLRATKVTSHFKQFNCIIYSIYLKQIVIKVWGWIYVFCSSASIFIFTAKMENYKNVEKLT